MQTPAPLFEDGPRIDRSIKRHDETAFAFLDRVDDVVFERVRLLLNEWFSRWPPEQSESLRRRFESRQDAEFLSAFWELYLHEGLRRLPGIVRVEPASLGSSRRRDLVVTAEHEVAVEARVVGESKEARVRDERLARALDMINTIENTDFSIDLQVEREGAGTAPGARLRDEIAAWLAGLDRRELRPLLEAGRWRELPSKTFAGHDWVFHARALPRSDERAASGDREHSVIGIYPGRSGYGNTGRIRRALGSKRPSKYGALKLPHVIALLDSDPFAGPDILLDALYGDEAVTIPMDAAASGAVPFRKGNGFWTPTRNTRVAAVLYGREIVPWSIATMAPTVWTNPWAQTRLTLRLPWARYADIGIDGALAFSGPDVPPHEYFELPMDWPGPEKPFDR